MKAALDAFGSVHVFIANAGILRDKSFVAMSEKEWDDVIRVHLRSVIPDDFDHGTNEADLGALSK